MRTLQDIESFELVYIGRMWYSDLAKQIVKLGIFARN